MAPQSALLWRQLRLHQIYGANTDVGKTVFTTVLCNAAKKQYGDRKIAFLKPVSTGHESVADHRCRHSPLLLLLRRLTGNDEEAELGQLDAERHVINCNTDILYVPSDGVLLAAIRNHVSEQASLGPGWLFIETAGGVHSPGPSGTTQADMYAPLRVPVLLVGDHKLGGISQTIAAYESLKLRGHDVEAILLFKQPQYENHLFLRDYFHQKAGITVSTLLEPPDQHDNEDAERESMSTYYQEASSELSITKLLEELDSRAKDRITRLETMRESASRNIWYPFTQQKLLTPERISVIDSAHGDFFQVLADQTTAIASDAQPLLQSAFDGSASWWTQGLGHGNSQLSLAAAYAAGRYGHVMFAEAIHEPALTLAEQLLQRLENPRLTRVFYTDNGSTGCEVAIKMALRAARNRYGWAASDELDIIGFKGSYHGDTMGAMDCSEPSVYNEKVEWYQGKGFWFDPPSVRCSQGRWHVDISESLQSELGIGSQFEHLQDVLDLDSRLESQGYEKYKQYIHGQLESLKAQGRKLGGVMLEPMILGAGGMIFVDPLFQRALIDVVRRSTDLFGTPASASKTNEQDWSGLPVIFDEVFVGLYRLGRISAASFLGIHPDITVNAKLLTGGVVPLCTTIASESIFDAFSSDDKSDALLHGHSYTAHAVGCQVAIESLDKLTRFDLQGHWDWAKANGWNDAHEVSKHNSASTSQAAWSFWSQSFVHDVSHATKHVSGVWALGNVLAISMRGEDGAGYKSNAAAKLQAHMRRGNEEFAAHTRVLGNVLYAMTSQITDEDTVRKFQALILEGLDE